ncbi:MAG: ABATE domain-containing protein, partial [Angustibacter sp.]
MNSAFPSPVGGSLALDFVNTVDPWHGPGQRDRFAQFADVVDFAGELGALPQPVGGRLLSATSPAAAESALAQIRALRLALYRVLSAAIAQTAVDESSLALVNT